MSQLDTASRVDDLVRRTRAAAVPAQVEQRTVPRSSVAELAATDWETVRDRLVRQRVDDRGPVERFLDLIDAPRNQLFAALNPGLEKRARERGERGAGGTGRVYFSDVLGELGMPSGIMRGALGLAGDIALDPLSWVGGPIFGTAAKSAKVTTSTGRAVRMSGRFARDLKRAERGIQTTPEIRRIAELAGGTEGLRSKVLGSVVPKGGPVRETVSRVKRAVLGGDTEHAGGLLAQYADKATTEATGETADLIRAFDDALLKYGDATGPGVRIGRDAGGKLRVSLSTKRGTQGLVGATQQIAHVPIPFTDFGLYVPAMSRRAQEAAATLGRASATAEKVGVPAAVLTARLGSLDKAVKEYQSLSDSYSKSYSDYVRHAMEYGDELRAMYAPGAEGTLIPDVPGGNEIKARHLRRVAVLDAMKRDMAAKRAEIAAIRAGLETDKTPRSLGQILMEVEKTREGMARAALMDRRIADLGRDVELAKTLGASENARLKGADENMRMLLDFAENERLPGMGPIFNYSDTGEVLLPADMGIVHAVGERVRPLIEKYKRAKEGVISAQRRGMNTVSQNALNSTVDADLAKARNDIWEATAALRNGAAQTKEQFDARIKAAWRSSLDEQSRRLLERMDAERPVEELGRSAASTLNRETGSDIRPPSWSDEVDRLHDDMKTVVDDAMARRGSVLEAMTDHQRDALRLVGDVLGTHDPIVNTAFLTPIDTVAKWVSGSSDNAVSGAVRRLGQHARGLVAGPPSQVEDIARHVQRSLGDGAERNVERWLRAAFAELDALAKKHGLRQSELSTLASAYVVRNLERTGVGRPFRIAIDGKPTAFAAALDEAVKSGVLSNATHPGLADELEAFARKHGNDLLRTITDAERADGILDAQRGAYFPGVWTRAAKDASALLARTVGEGGSAGDAARLRALEAFQRPKSTDSVIFDSQVLGRRVELFEADRVAQTMSADEINAIEDPTVRAFFADNKAALDEYDRMPVRPPFEQNDPMRLNELFDRGRFRILVGTDDIPGGFFDTNLLSVMASRLLQHEHAVARETLEQMVLLPNALPVSARAVREAANNIGATFDLGNGTSGKVVRVAGGTAIEVAGELYRPLRVKGLGKDHPLAEFLTKKGTDAIYPVGVAEPIERLAELLKPDNAGSFLRGIDYFSRLIKSGMLMRLGWTIGNIIGESLNFTINDGNFPAAIGKYAKPVIRAFLSAKNPEALRKIVMDVRGEAVRGDDLVRLVEAPITDVNRFTEPNTRLSRGIGESLPSRMGSVWSTVPGRGAWSADADAMMRHYAASGGSGGVKDYLKVRRDLLTDRFSRWLVEPWFRANGIVSDVLRSVAYLSLRDQGWNHAQAVNKMLNAGFDYSRLTTGERGVAQRLFPFWSWMKNNGIYQAKMLLEHPIYVGSLPVVHHAIEEAINGDKRLPMNARPSWLREQFAVQLGTDPLRRSALGLAGFIPQEQAVQLGGLLTGGAAGAQGAARVVATSLNPVIRTPLEIGAGREFFSDRTVGPASEQPDITVGKHALNQIAPYREYADKLPEVVWEQGAAAGAIRLLVGGRAQPLTDERVRLSKTREFREQEAKIRRAMRTAEFKKDAAARAAASYRLLDLYRRMAEQGYDVPKWAEKQLAQLTT